MASNQAHLKHHVTMSPDNAVAVHDLPEQPRLLGRSRRFTKADLPDRMYQWHAPRVNRWERLWVTAGELVIEQLVIEQLGNAGAVRTVLGHGTDRWMLPGHRWRVATLDTGSSFELEVYADVKGQAEAPQPLRSTLLNDTPRVTVEGPMALNALLKAMPTGERCIVEGRFDIAQWTLPGPACIWLRHPLALTATGFSALVSRSRQPFDLATYLGHDHAVIEAALGLTLAGDPVGMTWLRNTLSRHLEIEENLIFPAYLEAGGRQAWVDGLMHEHVYLRQYLDELDDADSRRKFLRLLDGHDEKEERVIYPDIASHVGDRAGKLLTAAIGWNMPTA